jgi:uncharacterized damage-inducible protein DinB
MTVNDNGSVALLRRMARNNALSNHRLSIAFARLQPGEFEAPRTSFFPSIALTANHILEADHYYMDALERRGHDGTRRHRVFEPARTQQDLAPRQAAVDRRLMDWCDALTPAKLAEEVPTDRGDVGIVVERIADLLLLLFQHQIHHRGQIHAMLAGTSVAPPQLDEFFLRLDRDVRRPDLAALGLEEGDV